MRVRVAMALVIAAALAAAVGFHWIVRPKDGVGAGTTAPGPPPLRLQTFETRHYTIASSAPRAQVERVAAAAESLHEAYLAFFGDTLVGAATQPKLQLVLYRDRTEFKAHNKSAPWAEAYYRTPLCHAYFDESRPNPYHWMVHEATHQLNREVARRKSPKWIEEGLASYFGASRIEDGRLLPGTIDADTYPIWWLPRLAPSGDLAADIRDGRIIPLRALIAGTGPDIGTHFNLYYIEYWSLTHFLFHHDDGRHARGYRQLIARGGSLADFERLIGPVDRVQDEWYAYLHEIAQAAPGSDDDDTVVLVPP